ncbi:MAG: hypothetical protein ACI87J_001085, partial [Colwellia sp.]
WLPYRPLLFKVLKRIFQTFPDTLGDRKARVFYAS